jgi:Tat protein secretion system quality control protein TatD with DNase activity
MAHPRCVGWGEMGLDYHYDNSPRAIQQEVFIRQLKHAVRLGKPLTIHTREAEVDTERILKEHVPSDHKVLSSLAFFCFPRLTFSMELCQRYTYIASRTRQTSHRNCFSISVICTSGLLVRPSWLSLISFLTGDNTPRGHHILDESEHVRSRQADGSW